MIQSLLIFITLCSCITGILSAECLRNDSHSAICRGQRYQIFPRYFHRNIIKLDLSDNNISGLTKGDLTMYPIIEELNLDHNEITSSNGIKDISNMRKLKLFYISGNKLINFDFGILSFNVGLVKIVIDNNLLEDINDKPTNLRNLRIISLRNNKLTRFPSVAFHNFVKLQTLDLRNNKLRSLPRDLHHVLVDLKNVLISGNPIINLDSYLQLPYFLITENELTTFSTSLRDLNNNSVESNQTTKFQLTTTAGAVGKCLRKISNFVSCINQGFSAVPRHLGKNIKKLVLSHNNISKLDADVLKLYRSVTEFNLDYNSIRSTMGLLYISILKNLRVFHISGNGIIDFDFTAFSMNICIEEIIADDNPGIYIKQKPTHLRKLRKVSLKNNKLDDFSFDAFKYFPKLETLDLRNNELKSLPKQMNVNFPSLANLLISNNPIYQLDSALFLKSDLINLRQVKTETIEIDENKQTRSDFDIQNNKLDQNVFVVNRHQTISREESSESFLRNINIIIAVTAINVSIIIFIAAIFIVVVYKVARSKYKFNTTTKYARL